MWLGDFDKALPHTIIRVQKEPSMAGLANLVLINMALNHLADAEIAAEKMRNLSPDVPVYAIYFLGFVSGDDAEMQHQISLAKAGLRKDASAGVDGITHEEYQKDTVENIRQIHRRLPPAAFHVDVIINAGTDERKERVRLVPALLVRFGRGLAKESLSHQSSQQYEDLRFT